MNYEQKKDFDVRFCEKQGIVDNITYRSDTYPDKFYQVLESLDLVMRNYLGDEMGTTGYDELMTLCATIKMNGFLSYLMPKTAKAFFTVMLNPKHSFKIFKDSGNVFGDISRAYADLRQYLIDNKEIVTEAYNKLNDSIIYGDK